MKRANLKIGQRLALAFGVTVLLSLASSGLALRELAAIEHNLDDIVGDNNVKLKLTRASLECTR